MTVGSDPTVALTTKYGPPVLEIDNHGYRGRRTKDIWKDQTAGGPKNLNSIRSLGNQTTWGTNKVQEAGRGQKLNIHIQSDKSILIKIWGIKIQNLPF